MSRISKKAIPKYTPCGYCFSDWATVWDHIIPFSARPGGINYNNLMPSCERCNSIARDLRFSSIEEKRIYILERRREKGDDV